MTPCRKCPEFKWCERHEACARSVRARWIIGRRNGFGGRLKPNKRKPAPLMWKTDSQYDARMRLEEDAADLIDGSASV